MVFAHDNTTPEFRRCSACGEFARQQQFRHMHHPRNCRGSHATQSCPVGALITSISRLLARATQVHQAATFECRGAKQPRSDPSHICKVVLASVEVDSVLHQPICVRPGAPMVCKSQSPRDLVLTACLVGFLLACKPRLRQNSIWSALLYTGCFKGACCRAAERS